MRMSAVAACVAVSLSTLSATAQDIDQNRKYAWGENIGWTNWRGANGGAQEPRVAATFMSGFVWGENVGWINLGDGTPGTAGGTTYGNTAGTDAGVNIAPNGDLFGLAWAENIGWINFDTRASLSAFNQQARLDLASRRFRGYAWGENVGWINLNDNGNFVALRCRADYNDDGISDILDLLDFLDDFGTCLNTSMPCGTRGNPDVLPDDFVDILDFLDFLQYFSEGCP